MILEYGVAMSKCGKRKPHYAIAKLGRLVPYGRFDGAPEELAARLLQKEKG
jgi:hypothetical protein